MSVDNSVVYGRNAVLEALKNRSSGIDKVLIQQGQRTGSMLPIAGIAKDHGIPVQEVHKKKLDELCGQAGRPANHQGVAALVSEKEYSSIEDILSYARELNQPPFIIILDGLTDTGNVGAIIRSAECMGVHGIIMGKRRAARLDSSVAKASSGAVELIRIAKVNNLNDAVRKLKEAGVFVYAADMSGADVAKTNITGASAFVIGAEGEGVSRLIRETCDAVVSIPLYGKTQSLNASVAAAVIMYEKRRQESK